MEKNQNIEEPELRWIETPKGRAIINAVSLTVLLAITQHFGYIAPGPPVTLENIILYGCTKYRHKNSEKGLIWNDKNLNIKWPRKKPIISKKDKLNITLKEYLRR